MSFCLSSGILMPISFLISLGFTLGSNCPLDLYIAFLTYSGQANGEIWSQILPGTWKKCHFCWIFDWRRHWKWRWLKANMWHQLEELMEPMIAGYAPVRVQIRILVLTEGCIGVIVKHWVYNAKIISNEIIWMVQSSVFRYISRNIFWSCPEYILMELLTNIEVRIICTTAHLKGVELAMIQASHGLNTMEVHVIWWDVVVSTEMLLIGASGVYVRTCDQSIFYI